MVLAGQAALLGAAGPGAGGAGHQVRPRPQAAQAHRELAGPWTYSHRRDLEDLVTREEVFSGLALPTSTLSLVDHRQFSRQIVTREKEKAVLRIVTVLPIYIPTLLETSTQLLTRHYTTSQ